MKVKDKVFEIWLQQQDLKIGILEFLRDKGILKATELHKLLKVSTPLIQYHLVGNIYSDMGLTELNLVNRIIVNGDLKGYEISEDGLNLLEELENDSD